MSLRLGYLTSKQRLIWKLKNEGITKASIQQKLKIRRKTIDKVLNMSSQNFFTSACPIIIWTFIATEAVFRRKIRGR